MKHSTTLRHGLTSISIRHLLSTSVHCALLNVLLLAPVQPAEPQITERLAHLVTIHPVYRSGHETEYETEYETEKISSHLPVQYVVLIPSYPLARQELELQLPEGGYWQDGSSGVLKRPTPQKIEAVVYCTTEQCQKLLLVPVPSSQTVIPPQSSSQSRSSPAPQPVTPLPALTSTTKGLAIPPVNLEIIKPRTPESSVPKKPEMPKRPDKSDNKPNNKPNNKPLVKAILKQRGRFSSSLSKNLEVQPPLFVGLSVGLCLLAWVGGHINIIPVSDAASYEGVKGIVSDPLWITTQQADQQYFLQLRSEPPEQLILMHDPEEDDYLTDFLRMIIQPKGAIIKSSNENGETIYIYRDSNGNIHTVRASELRDAYSFFHACQKETLCWSYLSDWLAAPEPYLEQKQSPSESLIRLLNRLRSEASVPAGNSPTPVKPRSEAITEHTAWIDRVNIPEWLKTRLYNLHWWIFSRLPAVHFMISPDAKPDPVLLAEAQKKHKQADQPVDQTITEEPALPLAKQPIVSIRNPEDPKEGYTLRVHNPESAPPLDSLAKEFFSLRETDYAPKHGCQLPDRTYLLHVKELIEPEPRFGFLRPNWFARAASTSEKLFSEIVSQLEAHHQFSRLVTTQREEKIASLDKLMTLADQYQKSLPIQPGPLEHKRLVYLNGEFAGAIAQETWLLFGLPEPGVGKIYLQSDVKESTDDFASGQMATVSKVVYKDGFKAVFKPSTTEPIEAAAAQKFEIKGSSETAKLPHCSVFFSELAALFNMRKIVPATHYAIYRGKPGSAQAFVNGVSISARKHIPEESEDFDPQDVVEIVQGISARVRNGFYLKDEACMTKEECRSFSEHYITTLYYIGMIGITRESVVDVYSVDLRLPLLQKQLANAQLLDYVGGSVDRNVSNILFEACPDDQPGYCSVALIDNDLSSASGHISTNPAIQNPLPAYQVNMAGKLPQRIDLETAQRLVNLDFAEVFELMKTHQLNSPEQIIAMHDRVQTMVEAIQLATVSGGHSDSLQIIEEWNDATFEQAMADVESYVYKINEARMSELTELVLGDPQKGGATWGKQFPYMSSARQAWWLVGIHPDIMSKAYAEFSRHVALATPNDLQRLLDYTDTVAKGRSADPARRIWLSRHYFGQMLGLQPLSPQVYALLSEAGEMSKIATLNSIIETLTIHYSKPESINPAAPFDPQFEAAFAFLSDARPSIRRACEAIYLTVKANPVETGLLRFWEMFNRKTLPAFGQKKKASVMTDEKQEEMNRLMTHVTANDIQRMRGTIHQRRQTIEKILHKNKAARETTKSTQLIDKLLYHFTTIEQEYPMSSSPQTASSP